MALLTIVRLAAVAVAAGCILSTGANSALSQEKKKISIGRVEKVWIGDANVVHGAKIDTGDVARQYTSEPRCREMSGG